MPPGKTPPQPVQPSRAPSPKKSRRGREALVIILTLVIAAVAIGGGYLIANTSILNSLIKNVGQPTAVPPLKATDALAQIKVLYPGSQVSVQSPLSDEVDLVTSHRNSATSTTLTPQIATQVLATYMRGYSKQSFWRWVDINYTTQSAVTYEVHATELWLISTNISSCSTNWTIYSITPTTIIDRGVAKGDYVQGTTTRPGTGTAPTNPYSNC